MDLSKILGLNKKEDVSSERGALFDGLSKIFEGQSEREIKLMTGLAGLLGTVAYADMEVSEQEVRHMREVMAEQLALHAPQIDAIMAILLEQRTRLFTIEDFIYGRLINEVCDKAQKKAILKTLFSLAAADGTVDLDEDVTVRKITNALQLSHKDFIEARTEFNEKLSWMKKQS